MKETTIMNEARILSIISSINSIEVAVRNIRDELIYLKREDVFTQSAHAEALTTAAAEPAKTLAASVAAMLTGEYDLRAMQTVCDQTGASRTDIIDALAMSNIDVVIKRRVHDGAELIGLADRN